MLVRDGFDSFDLQESYKYMCQHDTLLSDFSSFFVLSKNSGETGGIHEYLVVLQYVDVPSAISVKTFYSERFQLSHRSFVSVTIVKFECQKTRANVADSRCSCLQHSMNRVLSKHDQDNDQCHFEFQRTRKSFFVKILHLSNSHDHC